MKQKGCGCRRLRFSLGPPDYLNGWRLTPQGEDRNPSRAGPTRPRLWQTQRLSPGAGDPRGPGPVHQQAWSLMFKDLSPHFKNSLTRFSVMRGPSGHLSSIPNKVSRTQNELLGMALNSGSHMVGN